ncbi:MAG: ABC transporter permease [Bacteroidetes bacterium]|nr:MAG: ABC transporter permease [Bacteroidota bacterium]
MFDLDKWQEIYHSVSKHKLRTALTAFGVFWGIFMLIMLLGAGKGLENGVQGMFKGYSTKSFYMGANKTSVLYNGLKIGRSIEPNIEDLYVLKKAIPDIEYISPKQQLWEENNIVYKEKSANYNVQGVFPEWRKVEEMSIVQGRFINQTDLDMQRKVVVIGKSASDFFFKNESNVIGKYIKVRGTFFRIVGISQPVTSGWRAKEEMQTLWMPFTTMQITFNMKNKVYFWGCVVRENANSEEVIKKTRKYMSKKYSFDEADDKAVWSWSMETESNKFKGLFNGINLFVWLVGIGTIIAGIVGISNIMLIVVKERTREIGVRKALGATPYAIVSLIIQESIVITTVAGYVGLLLGVGLIEGLNYALKKMPEPSDFFVNPEVNFNVAIASLILLVVTGAFAGLIPAIRAAKIQPIEALRDE